MGFNDDVGPKSLDKTNSRNDAYAAAISQQPPQLEGL
jgi:hypothetical protein